MTYYKKRTDKTCMLTDGSGKEDKYCVIGDYGGGKVKSLRLCFNFDSGSAFLTVTKKEWIDLLRFLCFVQNRKKRGRRVCSGFQLDSKGPLEKRIVWGTGSKAEELKLWEQFGMKESDIAGSGLTSREIRTRLSVGADEVVLLTKGHAEVWLSRKRFLEFMKVCFFVDRKLKRMGYRYKKTSDVRAM